MSRAPLHHIVRVRSSDDLTFVRDGLMDEILVNANQLENSAQSTAASLWQTNLPFSVDPVLWRFQIPQWWRNQKGETKRNYRRLGAAYVKGTKIEIGEGALVAAVRSDQDWRTLASNVIEYQRTRLLEVPAQLDLLETSEPRHLRPARLIAPALVAYSREEDRINRLLVDACASVAGDPLAVQVIAPPERLVDSGELNRLIASIPTDAASAYFLWTPQLTEENLLARHDIFAALVRLISGLTERGIPVSHQYANYTTTALHDVGLAAVVHHLGWVDKGEPAQDQRFMMRSCRTYVPGVRHSLRFHQAEDVGRSLDAAEYVQRYCECAFCVGAFDHGQHPLDLLLEDQIVTLSNGTKRTIPTGRAVTANTWHYLWSRRLEVQAFSQAPAVDVIRRDIDRAALLAGRRDSDRLQQLANELLSA